jgi:hypothetical protein
MRIHLSGPKTLNRFTDGILRDGLQRCGCTVVSAESEANFGIIQIHGSPAAREADLRIINQLPKTVSQLSASIILLHRPDEIRDSLPTLSPALEALPATTGLAMLGNLLIDDPFYLHPGLVRRAIPHGFFNIEKDPLSHPIIIGSHTTWGEMRCLKRTLLLLKEIAKVGPNNHIIGYLGGAPADALSIDSVTRLIQELKLTNVLSVKALNVKNWREEVAAAPANTIFLNAVDNPPDFDVTFNVQLYHYRERIRMGESSGSLHASCGIPVIFEMNGSERLENLQVVKVPYADPDDANSADMIAAARQIVSLLDSEEYRMMLLHNRKMMIRWNNQSVAQLYVDFLEGLSS